jgi:hypothetical protein
MSEAAKQAIVSHVLRSLEHGGTELRIALLTRDATDEIVCQIVRRFVENLRVELRKKDPEMELVDGLSAAPSEQWACLQWRLGAWPQGSSICLQFHGNLRNVFGGFSAPSEDDLKKYPDEGTCDPVSSDTLDRIHEAVSARSVAFRGRRGDWWPVYEYLPAPLNDWRTTDASITIAGIENFNGRPFIDWLVDEFTAIREAVRPILEPAKPR